MTKPLKEMVEDTVSGVMDLSDLFSWVVGDIMKWPVEEIEEWVASFNEEDEERDDKIL